MANLIIYKASAGSGKTFRLIIDFLKKILVNPSAFKQVLTITFTNKATNEMKSRILETLFSLSKGDNNEYLKKLKNELPAHINIKQQAQKSLHSILNNFSFFNVITIDSFFQKILRSFIRELNMNFDFSLEIDSEAAKEEIYNMLIREIAKDSLLRNWIISRVRQKINDNSNWKLKKDILEISSVVFSEFFQQEKDKISFLPKELVKEKEVLDKKEKEYMAKIEKYAKAFNQLMTDLGLQYTDFYQGKNGVGSFFEKLINISKLKVLPKPNKYTKTTLSDKKWFTKQPKKITDSEIAKFHNILTETIDNFYILQNILIVKRNFFMQGILTYIYDMFKRYTAENNLFFLQQTGIIIKKIIGDKPQPMFYEKIGTYFTTITIDEFQDTSDLQYVNFKPLIEEIISSEENKVIVVGDVKQSIYRWRNANWYLLKDVIKSDFKNQIQEKTLDVNYRSSGDIVNFNNSFFQFIASNIGKEQECKKFSDIYPVKESDFQKVDKKHKGFVSLVGLPKTNYAETAAEKTIEFIKELQDKNYSAHDIAILVRYNKDALNMAQTLIAAQKKYDNNNQYNFKFISNEVLKLNSSLVVNLLIDVLHYLSQENKLLLTQIKKRYISLLQNTENLSPEKWLYDNKFEKEILQKINDCSAKQETVSLYELCQLIITTFFLDTYDEQLLFLRGAMDKIFEFENKNGNRLIDFLNWWDKNSDKFKVFFSQEQDAIQILTIHQSKGLEFPVVIIPFADWTYKKDKSLWMSGIYPFDKDKYYLINLQNEMIDNPIFSETITKNNIENLIDNLNLMYVAFTRPKTVLKVFYNEESKKNSISQWITNFIKDKGANNKFEKGELIHKSDTQKNINQTFKQLEISRNNENTSLLNMLAMSDSETQEQIQGKIIHNILQQIQTKNDIELVIRRQEFLSPENSSIIRNFFKTGLKSEKFSDWFSDQWTVYNEQEFINTQGHIIRPDRVIIKNNHVVVIDFKTGKSQPYHSEQVTIYGNTMKELGFHNVQVFLVYINPFEIKQVI